LRLRGKAKRVEITPRGFQLRHIRCARDDEPLNLGSGQMKGIALWHRRTFECLLDELQFSIR